MDGILEGGEQLERELAPERAVVAPAIGSVMLHLVLAGLIVYYGWLMGLFHHGTWGDAGAGGAMNVNLVSSALPLPAAQVNQNVLATETPSQAPATPSPKEQKRVDEDAIPILGKKAQPQPQNRTKTQQHQLPQQQNRAAYGEQAGSVLQHTMPQAGSPGVTVTNGDFGSMFPWYVQIIKTRVDQNWYRGVVDPRTPRGATAQIYFRVDLHGAPSNWRINTSSGSPTLDRSCLDATKRVETFGTLPSAYKGSYLDVTYDCTY